MAEAVIANPAQGLKTANTFGWDNPELDQINTMVSERHMAESAPMVQTVMKAVSPTATPQDRVEAANVFKTANEARIGDVLGAIVNLNPKEIYIALTGGADVKERGYDGASNPYAVVYNQRGELRGYEDPVTGKRLTEKQLAEIGPITSKFDITAERQAAFKAAGVTLADLAAARNKAFINTKNAAAAAGKNGLLISELGAENDAITQRLGPASLSPKALAFIRGISTIGVGDTAAVRKANETLNRFINGRQTADEWRKTQDALGGLNFGLQYREGEGLVDSSGKKVNEEKLQQLANTYEQSQSSNKNIQARQADMLARAQTIAAGDENLLRDITTLINNNAKISVAQNEIEQYGGIGVAKPNLPHQLGESFYAANLKAKSDEMYGKLSVLHSQFMNAKMQTLRPGQSPDIGKWEAEFSSLPEVKNIRNTTREFADAYIQKVKPDIERLNKQEVPRELTNQSMVTAPAAAVPPAPATTTPAAPAASAPPKPRPSAPSTVGQTAVRSLNDILKVK